MITRFYFRDIYHYRVRSRAGRLQAYCIPLSLAGSKTTPRQSIMTRSKKVSEENEKVTTLAVLRNVRTPKPAQEEAKENKKQPPQVKAAKEAKDVKDVKEVKDAKEAPPPEKKKEPRFAMFPREHARTLPCAQYKTDKGYRCPNCQRCYNARKNLVRHVTLECGREPQYKCPHCAYSKHRRNELKKHMLRKHPDRQELSPSPSPNPVK